MYSLAPQIITDDKLDAAAVLFCFARRPWPLFQEQQVSCSLLKFPGTERAPLAGCLIVISKSAHLHLALIWFDLTSD